MIKSFVDRLVSVVTLLALPVLIIGSWNAIASFRVVLNERTAARSRAALADSLIRNRDGAHNLGNSQTGRVILEFVDYDCPACRAADSVLHAAFERGADVEVAVLQFPLEELHDGAILAARGAVCAKRFGAFGSVHRALFRSAGPRTPESIVRLAHANGIEDVNGFTDCLSSKWSEEMVTLERTLGARLDVTGTPTFMDALGNQLGLGAVAALASGAQAGAGWRDGSVGRR
jgi:hypothetical protein